MKILLVTQWYYPEPAQTLTDFVQSMQAIGHEVSVLTGFPNYPSGKLFPGYRLRFWQKEVIQGTRVVRVPLYPDHGRSGLRRTINYVSFALSAAFLGPWLVRRPDVIHAYHPPLTIGWPAWLLSRLMRVPFTYEVQDMWPETLRATGMLSRARLLSVVGRAAKWVYRRAAMIRVISPGFRENLVAKGVPRNKIRVISNCVDNELYRPREPDRGLAQRLGLAGRFNVMFAGTIGLAQGLDTLLDAAAILADLPAVQFVLVGDGADEPRLRGLARQRNLANVRFLGRFPSRDMPGLYALADVLMLHLRDDPLFRITIPHKIFAYLASGKPILAAVEGDAADVVRGADAGLTCAPDDAPALADLVRRFVGMSAEERRILGRNGSRAALELYGHERLGEQLNEMFASVVGKR